MAGHCATRFGLRWNDEQTFVRRERSTSAAASIRTDVLLVIYHAQNKTISRSEAVKKLELAKIEYEGGLESAPLLPILSEDRDALVSSPLYKAGLLQADEGSEASQEDSTGTMAMTLGPWMLDGLLKLPDCNGKLRFSTTSSQGTLEVKHSLKIVLRVDRGDDTTLDSQGRKKRFDIIIEAPVTILCKCRTNNLPVYSPNSAAPRDTSPNDQCQCDGSGTQHDVSTLDGQRQFARLLSGQESPAGEHPPTYALASEDASTPTNSQREWLIEDASARSRSRSESTSRGRSRGNSISGDSPPARGRSRLSLVRPSLGVRQASVKSNA